MLCLRLIIQSWFSVAMLGPDVRTSSQAENQFARGWALFELALFLLHKHHNLLLLLRSPRDERASTSHSASAFPKHMLEPITSQNLE